MKEILDNKKILAILLVFSLAVNIGLAISLGIAKNQLRHPVATTEEIESEISASETILDGNSNAKTRKKSKETSPAKEIQPETDTVLEGNIQSAITGKSGDWDIWMESIADGTYAHVQQRNTSGGMISASLIKLFVMATVFEEIQNGTIQESSVEQDLKSMITISDNSATNRLIKLLGNGSAESGRAKVNAYCSRIGCTDSYLNRLMLEETGQQNYTTAKDCATILKMIYSGECVNAESSDKMLKLLEEQTVNDRIPQGLSGNATVAHKTGNLANICCGDVGIVFTSRGDYILCIINNNYSSDAEATDAIVNITKSIHNYFLAY